MAAPIIAASGNINGPKISSGIIDEPKTITIAAPNAAPAETPISPGSANGFLNNPCSDAPDIPRLAPTIPAKTTRGDLSCSKTLFCISVESPFKYSIMVML